MTHSDNLEMARRVAAAVREAGGRAYFVGGWVRDRLLGRACKDVDLEVHRVPADTLEAILSRLGEPMAVGASFGIMGLRHYDLDIALPRSEQATGRGHRDFAVDVDPFLGEERAARRRDFTVNAMMEDVLTGETLDFFGGREDLRRGVLRHVDDGSFGEDPLRVFRAAQFAARFDFTVAEETLAISSRMDVTALARERVMGELEKALLQAERPSVFFRVLEQMGQLRPWFSEAADLIGVPQEPRYHPEGDAWVHTLQVLDLAAGLRDRAVHPLPLVLAALCHDFGKAVTTEKKDGVIHSIAHETEGLPLVRQFLTRLTGETELRRQVLNLVELHMAPNTLATSGAKTGAFMRLYDRSLCPEDLVLLSRADYMGRVSCPADREFWASSYAEPERRLWEMLAEYRRRMAEPCLTGRDLLEAGLESGPLLGRALEYAHKLRLAGLSRENQLRQTLAWVRTESGKASP